VKMEMDEIDRRRHAGNLRRGWRGTQVREL
jgi:hypothetical protein